MRSADGQGRAGSQGTQADRTRFEGPWGRPTGLYSGKGGPVHACHKPGVTWQEVPTPLHTECARSRPDAKTLYNSATLRTRGPCSGSREPGRLSVSRPDVRAREPGQRPFPCRSPERTLGDTERLIPLCTGVRGDPCPVSVSRPGDSDLHVLRRKGGEFGCGRCKGRL